MMKNEILKKKPAMFLSLFGVRVAEFELIHERVAPQWATEVIGKYLTTRLAHFSRDPWHMSPQLVKESR
ncbi:hypothetical protein FACS189449_12700 [Alphaproteobacteria bacterium]|nr:hypothetical protein FACS189449_12700 [Alphaproteobacteria bacterium]